MKRLSIFLCLLLAIPVFAGGIEWVLLPVAKSDATRWAPPADGVKRAVSGVKDYVENEAKRKQDERSKEEFAYILSNWDSYSCQVIGDIFLGRKTIVLNFFPKRETQEKIFAWKKEEVSVKGGGAEYFRVRYDVEKSCFQEIWINAPR